MLVQGAQGKHIHAFNANDENNRSNLIIYYVVELLLPIKIDHFSIIGIFSGQM